jgi:hypothetical protein
MFQLSLIVSTRPDSAAQKMGVTKLIFDFHIRPAL